MGRPGKSASLPPLNNFKYWLQDHATRSSTLTNRTIGLILERDLYIQGLIALKAAAEDDTTGFFQIAGMLSISTLRIVTFRYYGD